MATIDLIVLGMLKKEALSAYDLQKQVEYRNISKWVKISTPSIHEKSHTTGGKRVHQKPHRKGRADAGEIHLFVDRKRE